MESNDPERKGARAMSKIREWFYQDIETMTNADLMSIRTAKIITIGMLSVLVYYGIKLFMII